MARRSRRSRCLSASSPHNLVTTFQSIADAVSQMQEALLMMQLKMERTDIAVSGVARTLNEQGPVVESIEKRMTMLETSFNRHDPGEPFGVGFPFSAGEFTGRRGPPIPHIPSCPRFDPSLPNLTPCPRFDQIPTNSTTSLSGHFPFGGGRPEQGLSFGANLGQSFPIREPIIPTSLRKGAAWSPYHEQCVPPTFGNRSPTGLRRSPRQPIPRARSVSLGPCTFPDLSCSTDFFHYSFSPNYPGMPNVTRSYSSDPPPQSSRHPFDCPNFSPSFLESRPPPKPPSPQVDQPNAPNQSASSSATSAKDPQDRSKTPIRDSPPPTHSASSSSRGSPVAARTSSYPEPPSAAERSVFTTPAARAVPSAPSGSSSSSSIFEGAARYAPFKRLPLRCSRSSTVAATGSAEPCTPLTCAVPAVPSRSGSEQFVGSEKKALRGRSVPGTTTSFTDLTPTGGASHSEPAARRPGTSESAKTTACSGTTCVRHPQQPPIPPKLLAALGKNLLNAAQEGRLDTVRDLLEAGANADFTFGSDWTPLHRASARGHFEVVSLLLKRGADVHARVCGFTALHMAAYDDRTGRCVSHLLASGADPNCRNNFGRTPLHYAAQCGNDAAVKALVGAGAIKAPKDREGRTPLDLAKSQCIKRILIPYRGRQNTRCGMACRKQCG